MTTLKPVTEDRRQAQGAWLFLASLTVFFLACLLLYAIYVILRVSPDDARLQPFYIPRSFLLTSVVLVAISILLHLAVTSIRREMRVDFVRYVILAAILAGAFFVIQGTGLIWMVEQMQTPGPALQNLYGFTFFLVVLHAVHVIGGAVGFAFVFFGIARGAFDHERHFPVRFCALYWHFLDVVWFVMMACFALAAYVANN